MQGKSHATGKSCMAFLVLYGQSRTFQPLLAPARRRLHLRRSVAMAVP